MLREARQAQGLHIAALSALIKVAQRKLESLEADRLDELPDATFTRALAQTVCRALKIDAAPVLAMLPQPRGYRLEQVGEGINAPFRDRPGRREPHEWRLSSSPAVWGSALLILAATVVYLLPDDWVSELNWTHPAAVPASASATSSTVALPTVIGSEPAAASAPASSEAKAIEGTAAVDGGSPAAAAPLQLHAKTQSWIEVHDAGLRVLLARHLAPGETVVLDGREPLVVTIGNAAATEVVFRGVAVDLTPHTRDNIARLELK